MSEVQFDVDGRVAIDTVVAAARRRPRMAPPYCIELVVFEPAAGTPWPRYQGEWLDQLLCGLYLAGVITLPSEVVQLEYRAAPTTGRPRAIVTVRSLADKYPDAP